MLFLFIFFSWLVPKAQAKTNTEIKLTNSLSENIGKAYAYCIVQRIFIDKICQKFPEIAPKAKEAQLQFNLLFSKSIDKIENVMNSHDINEWERVKQEIVNQYRNIDISTLSIEQAKQFILEVFERSKGRIPSPVLKTLLLFNPSYMNNPVLEITDGFEKEFKTDGKGKSLGLHLGVIYPASWEEKDSRVPHIVKQFVGKPLDQSVVQCLLYIDYLKDVGGVLADHDLDKMYEQLTTEEAIKAGINGINILGRGFTTIAGQKAVWLKFSLAQDTTLGKVFNNGILYFLIYKKKVIQLQFYVCNLSMNSESGATKSMKKYEGMFKLLASKLFVYDTF